MDKGLLKAILSIETIEDLELLFKDILTPSESEALSLRWKLLKDLNDGITQRKISQKYGISLCKITRGAKLLKDENSFVSKLFER